MFNSMTFMTQKEKEKTLEYIENMNTACKVDDEEIYKAMSNYDIMLNDLIHFNMMKCDLLINESLPIIPFTAEDYKKICDNKTEEERRNALCEILAEKVMELKNKQ